MLMLNNTYNDIVFMLNTFNIYVVMLLYNSIYYGHIYTWFIEKDDFKLCFFIGIRARVDNLFFRHCQQSISNISSYLLEGVRQFAISKDATLLLVVQPIGMMPKILREKGFVKFNFNAQETNGLQSILTPAQLEDFKKIFEKINYPIPISYTNCSYKTCYAYFLHTNDEKEFVKTSVYFANI